MVDDVLISIIIPVYNRENLIKDTIESVLIQTYKNWECILVDDFSTDSTIAVLEQYKEKDKRISFFSKSEKDKKGASASRNIGLLKAKGIYVQFLDSDDILATNKLEVQINSLNNEDMYSIVTCKWGLFNYVTDKLNLFDSRVDYKTFENIKDYFDIIGVHNGFFPPHCFLIHKDLINKVGYWNENLSMNDDGEFFFRIILNANKIIFTNKTYILYRVGEFENLSKLNTEEKAFSLVNSWKIIETLYQSRYNEDNSLYLNKKKASIYNDLKKKYSNVIKKNEFFFSKQIKNDTIDLRLKKINKRIINKLKIIFCLK